MTLCVVVPARLVGRASRGNAPLRSGLSIAGSSFLTILMLLGSVLLPAQRWHASGQLLPANVHASPLQDMAHMSWTRREGAPSDIAALAQTKDGYLWIGSSFGLFRFDGLQFQSYPFTSSDLRLPSSDVAALAADRDGGLWVGYRMGGISYLRNGRKVDYSSQTGLVSESTEQLVCRQDGSVWAVADGRLMHFTGSAWENYSASHGLLSDGLYSLFFDQQGNLWTADKGHIYELKPGAERFELVPAAAQVVNQIGQLPNGEIWIVDAWKSVRPLHATRANDGVRIPGVPMMTIDQDGSIWLANDFGGITRIRQPGNASRQVDHYTTSNGITDGQTRAILQDSQGAIWVGTARGLDRFRPTAITQFHAVPLDYYPALVADRSNGIWLHDMDKPLMRLKDGRLSFVSGGHGSSSLFQDSDGSVWMLDQITRTFYGYPEAGGAPVKIPSPPEGRQVETWCLGRDSRGALLACFEGHGLWRYSSKWEHVTAPALPRESPLSLVKGAMGRLWLGYAHNQIVLNEADRYRTFGQAQGLEINSVFAFFDHDGLVLAGGSDGLASFDGARFHSLYTRSPGALRGVSGIVQDRFGDLWLNAGSGVLRLPEQEWKKAIENPAYAMDYQLLNEQDGLIGSPPQSKPTPSAVIDHNGLLWFATSGHLVSVDPAFARDSVSKPVVLLQSVVVNGLPVRYPEGQPVPIGSRPLKTLEFEYIGVDLRSPDRVVYQYMLEGQDRDWQEAGNRRQAFYTNLPAGTYRFRVRAATGTGPWSELASILQLTVKAPFYRTSWFYLLVCAILLTLAWLVYRLRVEQVTMRMRERVEERARERIRIARDLHDTLLQGVQGLVLRFHFATERLPPEEPVREMLRDALDRADGVIHEGREKVRQLRAEAIAPGDLERYFSRAIEDLQIEGGARLSLIVKGQPRLLQPSVLDELSAIGREALTNAVRHARADHVVLEIDYQPRRLRLCCRDDGQGLDVDVSRAGLKPGHWGIPGMRERARGLGGKLELSSTEGSGTAIEVSVDGRRAYTDPDDAPRWSGRLSRWLTATRSAFSLRRRTGSTDDPPPSASGAASQAAEQHTYRKGPTQSTRA